MILLMCLLGGLIGSGLGLEEVPSAETRYDFIAIIVEIPDKFHCIGSLVSSRNVFTTCDCIGRFSLDSQLKLIFRPIQTYRHFVVLGIKKFQEAMKNRRNIKVYAIAEVLAYDGCTYKMRHGYVNNLGALKLAEDATIIPRAPYLMARDQELLEKYVIDRVYNEGQCIVLGYGSINSSRPTELLLLRIIDVNFITFMNCRERICPMVGVHCLLSIDIANNQEVCSSGSNESVNCYADRGSPLICEGHLTGVVKFVNCVNKTSPLLITRIGVALPYYLQLVSCSDLLESPGLMMSLFLTIMLILEIAIT